MRCFFAGPGPILINDIPFADVGNDVVLRHTADPGGPALPYRASIDGQPVATDGSAAMTLTPDASANGLAGRVCASG